MYPAVSITSYDHPARAVRAINPPPDCGATDRQSAVSILTQRLGQAVRVEGDVRVVLMEFPGNQVRLGSEAPDDVHLDREEITAKVRCRIADDKRAPVRVSVWRRIVATVGVLRGR